MSETRLAITVDQKPALVSLVRRLPGILAGRLPDEHNIASGFRARIGYAILSLIAPNFQELSKGMVGADGTKWPPLSKEYLAYGRRFGVGEAEALHREAGLRHSLSPRGEGDTKGLLSPEQTKLWRKTFADRFAWYVMQESDDKAKAHAAAVAWIVVKAAGGKTKLDVYGNRKVQILVDTGYLRGSLTQGTLSESGVDAEYSKPSVDGGSEQIFDIDQPAFIVVGSSVNYATCHHNAKAANRKRRLWPETFPTDWWNQILNVAVSGLSRISEIYRNGGI